MNKSTLTKDLRSKLKNIMLNEIEELPQLMKELEPKERLSILTKIMPFILPKIDSVHPTIDEPMDGEW